MILDHVARMSHVLQGYIGKILSSSSDSNQPRNQNAQTPNGTNSGSTSKEHGSAELDCDFAKEVQRVAQVLSLFLSLSISLRECECRWMFCECFCPFLSLLHRGVCEFLSQTNSSLSLSLSFFPNK